jgi:hypothetical protein
MILYTSKLNSAKPPDKHSSAKTAEKEEKGWRRMIIFTC